MRQSVKGIDFSAADCLRSHGAVLEPEIVRWLRKWMSGSTIHQQVHDSRLKRDCLDVCHYSMIVL